jgi:hypothetical protein
MAADGDDDIIGEPMIVHGLVGSLCRFAANRVKEPVHLVQITDQQQEGERVFVMSEISIPLSD